MRRETVAAYLRELPYVGGELLTRLGAHCSPNLIHKLERQLNYLEAGRWLRDKGFVLPPRCRSREEVFDAAARNVRDKRVAYLEFGVYKGDKIRYWSERLRNPDSRMHGFDSFAGLPETWNADRPKGYFSTAGAIPRIDDPRVKFFKGWFHETLASYTRPENEQLLVNIDADLYSSAKLVLTALAGHITPGAYLYFDELCDPHHELKAFDEFLADTGAKFEIVAAYRDLSGVMFRRIG